MFTQANKNSTRANYESLSDEIWEKIIREHLTKQDMLRLGSTCRFFHRLQKDEIIWKSLPLAYDYTQRPKKITEIEIERDFFSPTAMLLDGRLATGADDKTIKIWNLSTRVCEHTLENYMTSTMELVPLPHGQLISVYSKGRIIRWQFPPLKPQLASTLHAEENATRPRCCLIL